MVTNNASKKHIEDCEKKPAIIDGPGAAVVGD